MPVVDFYIHDVVRLRKPHPCGGFEWEIYRLGADIGLRCQTCGHHVLLARPVLEKRLKKFVSRGEEIPLSMFFPTMETASPPTSSAGEVSQAPTGDQETATVQPAPPRHEKGEAR